MSTITELMYGNINMFERPLSKDGRYEKLLSELAELERELEAALPEDKKELFKHYLSVTDSQRLIADESLFTNAFSLGARLMCDVFGVGEGGIQQ